MDEILETLFGPWTGSSKSGFLSSSSMWTRRHFQFWEFRVSIHKMRWLTGSLSSLTIRNFSVGVYLPTFCIMVLLICFPDLHAVGRDCRRFFYLYHTPGWRRAHGVGVCPCLGLYHNPSSRRRELLCTQKWASEDSGQPRSCEWDWRKNGKDWGSQKLDSSRGERGEANGEIQKSRLLRR